jgi:hypothetical protein
VVAVVAVVVVVVATVVLVVLVAAEQAQIVQLLVEQIREAVVVQVVAQATEAQMFRQRADQGWLLSATKGQTHFRQ